VIGRTQKRFWKSFHALPAQIQKLAREKYSLWKHDPFIRRYTLKSVATVSV